MLRFTLLRIGEGLLTLLAIAVVVFGLLHLIPYTPAYAMLGRNATPQAVARLNALLGLNLPVWTQFGIWFHALFFSGGAWRLITGPLMVTLQLLVFSTVIAFGLACLVALVQVRHPGTRADRILTTVTYALYAVPAFWLALMLIWVVALTLLWLPPDGWPSAVSPGLGSWALHLIMPVGTLALTTVGGWARYLRTTVEEALQTDYVRTARAKGASETRIIIHHAFRTSLLPLITLGGMSLPNVLNTVIVLEVIFYMPGAGQAFFQTVNGLDFADATGLAFFLAAVTVFGNVVADLLYGLADPRIQYR
jgi:peptide/nickel transport system permease protein